MRTETIIPLQKNNIQTNKNKESSAVCCGGAPANNQEACCKLDEEKKADGEAGCGCNSSEVKNTSKACC